ncbi:2826_t:CDS:1 [Diversispora eburnea]|uniref:2826_t:CDS:1 n=1 Tax=Diversispora eburnea TaxID=1213867 RepID=A0A9N8ZX72_9GLOM|nr:2826_t:CDS:1 [Diversispora eburnea]
MIGHLTFVHGLALVKITQINFRVYVHKWWFFDFCILPLTMEITNPILKTVGRRRKNKLEPGTSNAKPLKVQILALIALGEAEALKDTTQVQKTVYEEEFSSKGNGIINID